MDWKGLRRHLESQHPGNPQVLARIDHALRAAEEALTGLALVGHRFWLTTAPQAPFPDWPRMLFHLDAAPNGRLVRSEFEAEELGPGWFDSLEKSQHWDGVETQFAGRGGVPRSGLPASPITLDLMEISRQAKQAEAAKLARIAEFKAQVAREREEGELRDAKQKREAGENNASGGARPEVRQENGHSAEGGEGVRGSGPAAASTPPAARKMNGSGSGNGAAARMESTK